jgi:hypothetical protein
MIGWESSLTALSGCLELSVCCWAEVVLEASTNRRRTSTSVFITRVRWTSPSSGTWLLRVRLAVPTGLCFNHRGCPRFALVGLEIGRRDETRMGQRNELFDLPSFSLIRRNVVCCSAAGQ